MITLEIDNVVRGIYRETGMRPTVLNISMEGFEQLAVEVLGGGNPAGESLVRVQEYNGMHIDVYPYMAERFIVTCDVMVH